MTDTVTHAEIGAACKMNLRWQIGKGRGEFWLNYL